MPKMPLIRVVVNLYWAFLKYRIITEVCTCLHCSSAPVDTAVASSLYLRDVTCCILNKMSMSGCEWDKIKILTNCYKSYQIIGHTVVFQDCQMYKSSDYYKSALRNPRKTKNTLQSIALQNLHLLHSGISSVCSSRVGISVANVICN